MTDKKDHNLVNVPDFLKNIPSRKLEDIKPKLFLGDTPEQLNVKCANWVDVLVIDGKAYTTQNVENLLVERDALAAQVEALTKTIIEAKAIYEEFSLFVWNSFVLEITNSARVCNRREIYEMMDEKFQSVIPDGYIATTPQQCLRDVQAEAVKRFVEFNTGRYTNHFDASLSDALKTYLAQMQQGGA